MTNVACIQLAILRGEQREDHASRAKFTADVDLHKLLRYIIARDPGKKTRGTVTRQPLPLRFLLRFNSIAPTLSQTIISSLVLERVRRPLKSQSSSSLPPNRLDDDIQMDKSA